MSISAHGGVFHNPGFLLDVRGSAGTITIEARPTLTYADITARYVKAEQIDYSYSGYDSKAEARTVGTGLSSAEGREAVPSTDGWMKSDHRATLNTASANL